MRMEYKGMEVRFRVLDRSINVLVFEMKIKNQSDIVAMMSDESDSLPCFRHSDRKR